MSINRLSNVPVLAAAALVFSSLGCASTTPAGTFPTPEHAVRAVGDLASSGDSKRAEEIFGPDGMEVLRSGDPIADKADAAKVKALIAEKFAFEDGPNGEKIAVFGNDPWPFPIPLEKVKGGWRFDVAAGKEEILSRRIGRNELWTLATLHAIVDAQHEYATTGRDGHRPAYAQKLMSDPGRRNGLYWPVGEGLPQSPLGPLVAEASAEGYAKSEGGPIPYHGYYFRILVAEGKNAPGGERECRGDDGLLTRCFALLAWPAKHANSGLMTFMMSGRGIGYQKDLGDDTQSDAPAIVSFDPDNSWNPVVY